MSPSSLNKCIDALRANLEIARSQGMVHENPANAVPTAAKRQKRLNLPPPGHFQDIVKRIATTGSRWSTDAADMVRELTCSGVRLSRDHAIEGKISW